MNSHPFARPGHVGDNNHNYERIKLPNKQQSGIAGRSYYEFEEQKRNR
ncbi:MAG TPA: hypothetical protein VE594_06565 [Nitrososphaeraceae archaeon]|nr:hypothetical protein [Nitrososphaeraceae archaeon]